MNPGGLYGKATPENFPYVNDYRNGVVAEGMKVLGFVNRYSRGVQAVQDELRANGNGDAEFQLHLATAFLVIEHITSSVLSEPIIEPIIEQAKNPAKQALTKKKPIIEPKEPIIEPIIGPKEPIKELSEVLALMRKNPAITYAEIGASLGIKTTAIYERIKKLKKLGLVKRDGGRSSGLWIVI